MGGSARGGGGRVDGMVISLLARVGLYYCLYNGSLNGRIKRKTKNGLTRGRGYRGKGASPPPFLGEDAEVALG